jgi:hypothetical protein
MHLVLFGDLVLIRDYRRECLYFADGFRAGLAAAINAVNEKAGGETDAHS